MWQSLKQSPHKTECSSAKRFLSYLNCICISRGDGQLKLQGRQQQFDDFSTSIIFDQIWSLLTSWNLVSFSLHPWFLLYFMIIYSPTPHIQSDARGVHGRLVRPISIAKFTLDLQNKCNNPNLSRDFSRKLGIMWWNFEGPMKALKWVTVWQLFDKPNHRNLVPKSSLPLLGFHSLATACIDVTQNIEKVRIHDIRCSPSSLCPPRESIPTDGPTDRRTDGRTNGRTHLL